MAAGRLAPPPSGRQATGTIGVGCGHSRATGPLPGCDEGSPRERAARPVGGSDGAGATRVRMNSSISGRPDPVADFGLVFQVFMSVGHRLFDLRFALGDQRWAPVAQTGHARIASAARWNRFMELSTTIWNGVVVVVPCSQKPRWDPGSAVSVHDRVNGSLVAVESEHHRLVFSEERHEPFRSHAGRVVSITPLTSLYGLSLCGRGSAFWARLFFLGAINVENRQKSRRDTGVAPRKGDFADDLVHGHTVSFESAT